MIRTLILLCGQLKQSVHRNIHDAVSIGIEFEIFEFNNRCLDGMMDW